MWVFDVGFSCDVLGCDGGMQSTLSIMFLLEFVVLFEFGWYGDEICLGVGSELFV